MKIIGSYVGFGITLFQLERPCLKQGLVAGEFLLLFGMDSGYQHETPSGV